MITNLTLNDNTQRQILQHLKDTDQLLAKVSSNLSGVEKVAHIYAMPDLGIPSNATRILGGFYTGACYTWDCDVPFVPVDATVNVCGTGVYRLKEEISILDFKKRVDAVFQNKNTYEWNYDQGNHFVSLTYSNGDYGLEKGQYLVVHASAIEYKYDKEKGLYPTKGNWYYDSIKTEYLENSNRYLRYIDGKKAKHFYKIASDLRAYNIKRNRDFAQFVLGDLWKEEIINISHYGIPATNCVCIGCQWENRLYTLLTSPGSNIYLVRPTYDETFLNCFPHQDTELLLSTHGLGVEFTSQNNQIIYQKNSLVIGDKTFQIGDKVNIDTDTKIRTHHADSQIVFHTVSKVLENCPGTLQGELHQLCAFTKRGFSQYDTTLVEV